MATHPVTDFRPEAPPLPPPTFPALHWYARGWAITLGAVNLAAGGFLLLMFIQLFRGYGTDPWGPINDFLYGITGLMTAMLVPVLSRRAARSRLTRAFVGVTVAAAMTSATSSFLLVARRLSFETSTPWTLAGLLVQVAWLLWINYRYATDPATPRGVVRYGLLTGWALVAAGVLAAASYLLPLGSDDVTGTLGFSFPWISSGTLPVLIPVVGLGGAAWLAWPAWYLLVGRATQAGRAD